MIRGRLNRVPVLGRWRVRVCLDDYGRVGRVILTRRWFSRFYQHGILVTTLDLTREDAEDQIAEARAKALSLARSISNLDRTIAR
jgi:hypothetical protein